MIIMIVGKWEMSSDFENQEKKFNSVYCDGKGFGLTKKVFNKYFWL